MRLSPPDREALQGCRHARPIPGVTTNDPSVATGRLWQAGPSAGPKITLCVPDTPKFVVSGTQTVIRVVVVEVRFLLALIALATYVAGSQPNWLVSVGCECWW